MIMTIREVIVSGLKEYTGLQTIDTDSNYRRPEYPFYSFKFTTLLQKDRGQGNYLYDFPESLDSNFKYDYRETPCTSLNLAVFPPTL